MISTKTANQATKNYTDALAAGFELHAVGKELWPEFARYHYRSEKLFFPDRIFAIRHISGRYAGIIVYSYPQANSSARNKILSDYHKYYPARLKLKMLNYELRTISRLVVLPEFRGMSLASELIRRTIPMVNVRFVEASTVMGNYSSCFVRAGMSYYEHESTSEKKTMQKQLLSFGLDIHCETETMVEEFNRLCQREQNNLLVSMHGFCCHYHRSLRKQKPDKLQLGRYLKIIRFRLNTRPGYFFYDLAGEIA